MDYPLKIAQSNPHRERLEKAITNLLGFIEAGAIYVSYNECNKVIVTFILKENWTQYEDTLSEKAYKLIDLYPDFVFKFINSNWADYGFKKGKPYFIQHCTLKELVYFEPDAKIFYPHKNNSKRLLKKAKKRFYIDIEAAVVSFRNVSIYTRNNKTKEAAFALHQTLRYIYICASEFLTPEFISSTCLLIHYDYIIDFAPTLKNILDKEVQADKEIFTMLNAAYGSVVQNSTIAPIDSKLIARARVKIELMQREINRLFQEYTKLCKEKVNDLNRHNFLGKSIFNQKMQPNYIIANLLDEISTTMTASFKIRSIYCFGYASIHSPQWNGENSGYSKNLPKYHFYLLVVNLEEKEKVLPELQTLILKKFKEKCKVTILTNTAAYVSKRNRKQKYFFDSIISNGYLVYNNPSYLVYSKTYGITRDIEFSTKYLESRIQIAKRLLNLAQNCFNDDSTIIKKMLFRKVIEQLAIGNISTFLGYHSGKYSLSYLFSLLKYVQEVKLPFDFKNEKEKVLYKILLENANTAKGENINHSSISDIKQLEEKCIIFLKHTKEIREKVFKKLEQERD